MGNSTAGIYAKYWHLDYKDDFLKLLASIPLPVSIKRHHLQTWSRLNDYQFTYEEVKLGLSGSIDAQEISNA